jgi:hypothetical protein
MLPLIFGSITNGNEVMDFFIKTIFMYQLYCVYQISYVKKRYILSREGKNVANLLFQ